MRRAIKLDESLVTTHKQGSRRGWKKIDQFEHELTQTRVLLYMSTNTADRTIFDCTEQPLDPALPMVETALAAVRPRLK